MSGKDYYTFDSTRLNVQQAGSNLIIGDSAGINNTVSSGIGFANTFLGAFAGLTNTIGQNNSFIGFNAGRNNLGIENTYLGSGAGSGSVPGPGNIAIGNTVGADLGLSRTAVATIEDNDTTELNTLAFSQAEYSFGE